MRMFLIVMAPLVATLLGAAPALPPDQDDQTATVRRIAATAALAAQEYGVGVHAGKVVAPAEVEEARLFLSEARRTAALLPSDAARLAMVELDSLFAMVSRTAPADSLALRSRKLGEMLATRLGVTLDEVPSRQPLLARGARIYQTQCASCHGSVGRGDGIAGAALTPPPADLTDFRKLADVTPLDYYLRTTIGVAGTAMPAYEGRLTADERWAVALYATLLHLPAPRGEVPAAMREFATTARMTDIDLAAAVAPGQDAASPEVRAHIAALRVYGTAETRPDDAVLVFNVVRRQLDSVLVQAAAAQGERASTTAFDAYMTFEQVELGVRAKNPALANALEAGFAALRTRAAGGATPAELREIHLRLLGDLENAERTIGDQLSPLNLFVQSFVLLLREGLEA
ncbi:MAG: cytochrome c, partial [Gemmatimonadota bacterium]